MAEANGGGAAAMTFGRHLRTLRRRAGLTQERLAERAGVSPDTVSNLERGYRATQRVDTAALLADALGLAGADRDAYFAVFDGAPAGAVPEPPSPPDLLPSPLPRAQEGLFGRDDLLAAVLARLDDPAARVVTLHGTGGVGKTRLALEVARRAAAEGRQVAWVALESLVAADEVLPAIARAVGAAGQPQADPVARIVDAVAGRDTLLVVDNWEHVLEAVPGLAAIAAEAPRLRVLATSREALRIGGEVVIPVAPLPVPGAHEKDGALVADNPAVALFLDRAGLVGEATTLQDACRIVTSLDGVPLAIELAAAQRGALSVGAIADLLDRFGIDVLDAGRRDLPDRLRSMGAAIRWSHDLLGERDRRLLRLLCVFRGGFAVGLLEEVCDRLGEPRLGRSLPALVRASLVGERPGERGAARFDLLSPIRLFAEAELDAAGETAAAERAHRAAMVDHARRAHAAIVGPDALAGLAAMDRERENLTAALDRAIGAGDARDAMALAASMGLWWEIRGDVAEGFRWLQRALSVPGSDGFPEDVSRAGRVAAMLAAFLGRADQWQAIAERMLRVATEAGDAPGSAIALTWLGDHAWFVGQDASAARAFHERALSLVEPLGDSIELAQVCDRLGDVLVEQGEAAAALAALDCSVAVQRRLGAVIFRMNTLTLRATALELLGHGDEARASLVEAVDAGRSYGNPMTVAIALMRIAAIDAGSGDADRVADAGRLLAASDAAHARNRVPIDPALAPVRERALAAINATFGESERDRLLAEGQALSEAETLVLVRGG